LIGGRVEPAIVVPLRQPRQMPSAAHVQALCHPDQPQTAQSDSINPPPTLATRAEDSTASRSFFIFCL
jgi:hypothetical protein